MGLVEFGIVVGLIVVVSLMAIMRMATSALRR